MNVLEEISTNNSAGLSLKAQMSELKNAYEEKMRVLRNQKYDEESAFRDKWRKIEDDAAAEFNKAYDPLKEEIQNLYKANTDTRLNLIIARMAQQGYRCSEKGIPLNYHAIMIDVEPPKGTRKKYELNIKVWEALSLINNGGAWERKLYEKRFDTLPELNTYFERHRDRLLAPVYAEDLRLTKIAVDPKYRDIVNNEFDMIQAWGSDWSGETSKVSKHSVTVDHWREDNRIKLRFVKGNTFKISAQKGKSDGDKFVPSKEPLTNEDIEKIEEHVKSHLSRLSVYFVQNPELIWE